MDDRREAQPDGDEPHRVERGLSVGPVVAVTGGSIFFLVLLFAGVALLRNVLAEGKNIPEIRRDFRTVDPIEAPGPDIEVRPTNTYEQIHAENEQRLQRYQWIEQGETARIPIDRAIELTTSRGLLDQPAQRDNADTATEESE